MIASLAFMMAACEGAAIRDSWSLKPQAIAGEELAYHELHGADAHDWALEVLDATDRPAPALRSATGFTFPDGNEYQSHVIQVVGVDGQTLTDPLMKAIVPYTPTSRTDETIAGKVVAHYTFLEGDGPKFDYYVYAFDDVAIAIFVRRPQELEEALRALP